jgi:hypothetical protein
MDFTMQRSPRAATLKRSGSTRGGVTIGLNYLSSDGIRAGDR